jgi:hypothetical protein
MIYIRYLWFLIWYLFGIVYSGMRDSGENQS